MADALDSKSSDRKIVWVQVPPPADRLKPYFAYEKPIEDEQNQLRTKTHETASKCNLFVNHSSTWESRRSLFRSSFSARSDRSQRQNPELHHRLEVPAELALCDLSSPRVR